MKKHILGLLFLLILTLSCSMAAAEGMAYREYPISASIMVESSSTMHCSQSLELSPGDYFRVELFTAGGTGYQWTLTNEKPELVKIVYQHTGPVDVTQELAGGKTRTVFIFQVNPAVDTPETLQFALKRAWEKTVKPIQSLDISVTARP